MEKGIFFFGKNIYFYNKIRPFFLNDLNFLLFNNNFYYNLYYLREKINIHEINMIKYIPPLYNKMIF